MRRHVLLLVVLLLAGCATFRSDSTATVRVTRWLGWVTETVAVPLPRAEAAARAALTELDMVGIDGGVDRLKARLHARMVDGRKVRVSLTAVDFQTTQIRIRVGTLGDRAVSQQIVRHIRQQLGEGPG